MFPPDQSLPSKESPVQYVFMGDYALILCACTHTHISNEKIPQKLQEESRRTSSVLFHVPAGSLQMFLVQLPVSHVLGNQCYFNQTCFQILS